LHVSRNSLREALRVLEHAGVLDIRTGSGTYVTSEGGSNASLARAQAAAAGEHSPLDLIVARLAIEPVCAEHAALSHHPSDLAEIEALVDDHARRAEDGQDIAGVDLAFHLAVAAASRNGALLALERTLIDWIREQSSSGPKVPGRRGNCAAAEFVEHHRQVLEAIKRGDARRAHQLMAMHMSAVETNLLAELDSDGA
jgi:GntR family transcriptional repressor for pyruvate dehydrogenase complex